MSYICPNCRAEHNYCPDYSIYHLEGRSHELKEVRDFTKAGAPWSRVKVGPVNSIEVTEYIIQECTTCHQLMIVGEEPHSILRAERDE